MDERIFGVYEKKNIQLDFFSWHAYESDPDMI